MSFSKESISSASSTKEPIFHPELWKNQTSGTWATTSTNWNSINDFHIFLKESPLSESFSKETIPSESLAKEASYTPGMGTHGFKLAFFSTDNARLPDEGVQYVLYFYENLDSQAALIDVTAGTTDEVRDNKYIEESIKQGRFVFTGHNEGVYEVVSSYTTNTGGSTTLSDTSFWLTDESLGYYNMPDDDIAWKIFVNQISGSTPSDIHTGGLFPVDEDDIMYLNIDNHFLQDIDFEREN